MEWHWKQKCDKVAMIYDQFRQSFDKVLVGENEAKHVIITSLMCSPSSKILLVGGTGYGKTTLAQFLANNFIYQKVSMVNIFEPSDIGKQLKEHQDLQCLHIDELNRGKTNIQNVFIDLFTGKKLTVQEESCPFPDFYVIATQNDHEFGGVYPVSQALYDRFDVSISFEGLTDEEKRILYFRGFKPDVNEQIKVLKFLPFVHDQINHFPTKREDESLILEAFSKINKMKVRNQELFSGSNVRAEEFAIRVAKLNAMLDGRRDIFPSDIAYDVKSIYMHRIDQNVADFDDSKVTDAFDNVKEDILSIERKRVLK